VSVQRIGVNLTILYQADNFVTNSAMTVTNEASFIRTAYIDTGDITRCIRLDWGPNWTNWVGAFLVREVNLATGAEGIFLRINGRQTNVSWYFTNLFGASYSNNFSSQVSNWFPAFTNNFTPTFPLEHGSVVTRDTGATTNYSREETFVFSSFNSTNIKFNLLGLGPSVPCRVSGRLNGTLYSSTIDQFSAFVVGTLLHNVGTNRQDSPGVPGNFVSGTAEGYFTTSVPVYLGITNGP
jgi:hypothetical protein